MPLPTISLRVAPEHHRIIRDIAAALRTRPDLIDALRDVLQSPHGVTERDTDVLPSIYERLESNAQTSLRIMTFAENINARVKALETQMAEMTATPPRPSQTEPREPRPATAGKRRPPTPITDDIRRRVHDLRNAGSTRDAIAAELAIGGSTVSRILEAPRPAD